MARLAKLEKGEWDQFDCTLCGTTLTAEEVRKLLKHPEVLEQMYTTMRQHPAFRLVHGFYNLAEYIKASADAKVRDAGFNPDEFEWIGSPEPPSFDEDDPEVAVALYDTLDTLYDTLDFYWKWIVNGQEKHWVWDQFKNDPEHVRHFLDHEHEGWKPRTRQWVKVKLNAHQSKSPKWACDNVDHEAIAGLEIMAVYAQHPRSLSARNGKDRPYTNVTAIDYNWERDGQPWQDVLYVYFFSDRGRAELHARHVEHEDDFWSCPVLVRE